MHSTRPRMHPAPHAGDRGGGAVSAAAESGVGVGVGVAAPKPSIIGGGDGARAEALGELLEGRALRTLQRLGDGEPLVRLGG